MISSEDEGVVILKQIRSRRRGKTTNSRTPPTTVVTAATVKNVRSISSPTLYSTTSTHRRSSSSLTASPFSPITPTSNSPIQASFSMTKTFIDNGDSDDRYSDDDNVLWHRGGGSGSGRGTTAAATRASSSTGRPFNNVNGDGSGPHGHGTSANPTFYSNQAQAYSTPGSSLNYDEPPTYTKTMAPQYDYTSDADHPHTADIVGSSSYSSPSTSVKMSLRARIFSFASSSKGKGKAKEREERLISTKPGERGAGETETELDEPPKHLPTARLYSKAPLIPPYMLQKHLTPLLFEGSRLLSVVPAFIAMIWCILHIIHYQADDGRPDRLDYFVSMLWTILTGYQCLALTTGLMARWRVYYPPLPTLIRLIALQAICWPATIFTLQLFDVTTRPVSTWAIIGTTTCASRSVQIWVTSNLWWDSGSTSSSRPPSRKPSSLSVSIGGGQQDQKADEPTPYPSLRWRGGRWGGRTWDWNEVVWKCMLPAGTVYCVMAWSGEMRREWNGC